MQMWREDPWLILHGKGLNVVRRREVLAKPVDQWTEAAHPQTDLQAVARLAIDAEGHVNEEGFVSGHASEAAAQSQNHATPHDDISQKDVNRGPPRTPATGERHGLGPS